MKYSSLVEEYSPLLGIRHLKLLFIFYIILTLSGFADGQAEIFRGFGFLINSK